MRYIYIIRCLFNEKLYVGQTLYPTRRRRWHFNAKKSASTAALPLYRAIQRYGKEAFEFGIIEECVDELTDEREKHWIKELGTLDPSRGYNMDGGGNVAKTVSDHTRQKQSEATRRRFERMTPEQRETWKASLQKRPACTVEQAQKISEYHRGRPKSVEHRRKIAAARCRLAEEHFEAVALAYQAAVPVARLCEQYSVGPSSIYTALRRFGLIPAKKRDRRASTSGSEGQPSRGQNPAVAISQ